VTREQMLAELGAIVGAHHVLADADDMAPHLKEWRDLYRGKASCVVRPGSTAEVAALMVFASQHRIPVVPQGGNTGLVGGQIPIAEGREIILSLTRLDKLRAVDVSSDSITVEAGMTLQRVQEAAEAADRLFPLSLASEGSCTIGGNLATNAGGTAVLAYGNTRDLCLGLEVVLPDGRIVQALSALRKDNTGYDLKHMFIGSEGTLGIITAASLKLFARPRSTATAFLAVPSPEAALALLLLAKGTGAGQLVTFELMPRIGIDYVLKHAPGTRDPLAETSPWYVLAEFTSPAETDLNSATEALLGEAFAQGLATDGALAASLDQRLSFWRLREAMSEVQRFEGGSIKHDVSVPVQAVPELLARGTALLHQMVPGGRPVAFGHLGDGNIHFNLSQPVGADKAAFLARWDEINAAMHALVHELHGSVSAEHGIGRLKRHLLPLVKDPVALAVMRQIKQALDPLGIMNPGAVL
jgi:FAD/FMN-containing dehydrogenase